MKKTVAVLLIISMVLCLAACGSGEATSSINVVEIKDKLLQDFQITDAIEMNNDLLLNQYGIEAQSISNQGCFIVQTGLFPAEIVMVEAVDEAAAQQIAEKLNTRLDSLKAQSKSYDAESYEIAQASQVLTNGNYVAMFFSEHGAEMEEIYNSYF